MSFTMPESHRAAGLSQRLYGWKGDETCGVFQFQPKANRRLLTCIASSGGGWEHVSISCYQGAKLRTPTWEEMCLVKAAFWDAEDCVVQYHPPEGEYVNQAEALHLWRPNDGQEIARPPAILVGTKTKTGEPV